MADFDQYNIEDFLNYKIKGKGGTAFNCNWQYLKDNQIEPKKLIVFSDMKVYDGNWGDPNYVDTLFIAHKSDVKAPFGTTVKYQR